VSKMINFGGHYLDQVSLRAFLRNAASKFGWTSASVIDYSKSRLQSLSSHSKLLKLCSFALAKLDVTKEPLDLPLLPLEGGKKFCLLTHRKNGAEKLYPTSARRGLCELPELFIHRDFIPFCTSFEKMGVGHEKLGICQEPKVEHILAFMRTHHSTWEMKLWDDVEIKEVSDDDMACLKRLWIELDKMEVEDAERFLNWAIVPTLNGTLIKLRAIQQALVVSNSNLKEDMKAGLAMLGLHVVQRLMFPGFLSQDFQLKMKKYIEHDRV